MGGEQPAPHAADEHKGGGFLGGIADRLGLGGHHEEAAAPEPAPEHEEQPTEVHEAAESAPEPPMGELADTTAHTDVVATPEVAPLDLRDAPVTKPTKTETGDHVADTDGTQEGEPSHVEVAGSAEENHEDTEAESASDEINLDPIAHAQSQGAEAHEDTTTSAESPIVSDGGGTESVVNQEVTATDDEAAAFLKEAQAASAGDTTTTGASEVSPVDAEATPVSDGVTVQDGEVLPIAPQSDAGEVETTEADEAVHQEGVETPTSAEEPPPAPESEVTSTPEVASEPEVVAISHVDAEMPAPPVEETSTSAAAESEVTVDREATIVPETVTDTPDAEKDPAQPSAEALAPVIDLQPALAKIDTMQDDLSALRTAIQEAIDKQKAA